MLSFYLAMLEDENDKIKFATIYERYKGTMEGTAMRILHNKEDADEVVQDSFLKIIRELDKINLKSCNKTRVLIAVIVRDTCFDFLRKKKRNVKTVDFDEIGMSDEPTAPESELPMEMLINEQSYKLLKEKIAKLSDIYRSALLLTYEFGYSDKEIARILGTTPQNIRVRIHRAKQLLKKLLQEVQP